MKITMPYILKLLAYILPIHWKHSYSTIQHFSKSIMEEYNYKNSKTGLIRKKYGGSLFYLPYDTLHMGNITQNTSLSLITRIQLTGYLSKLVVMYCICSSDSICKFSLSKKTLYVCSGVYLITVLFSYEETNNLIC